MIAHHVICMSVVCSAFFIVAPNADAVNILKFMVGDKKTNNGTTRSKSASALSSTVATVTVPVSSGVRVHVATDIRKKLPTNKNDSVDHDIKVERNINDTAVFQRLCSAILYAVTMTQNRSGVTDSVLAAGSTVTSGQVTQGQQQQQQQQLQAAARRRKRFRLGAAAAAAEGTGLDAQAWRTKPTHSYRDPILAQETSRGVDYLTSYPLAVDGGIGGGGGGADHEEKYYEDLERPAKVWKIGVASEPKKSSKNGAAADEDDDDDDELAATDDSRL